MTAYLELSACVFYSIKLQTYDSQKLSIETQTQLQCALSPVCAARLLFMYRIFTIFVAEHVIQLLFLLCTLNIANYLLTTPEPILNSFTLYLSPSPPYTEVSLQQNHTQNVV